MWSESPLGAICSTPILLLRSIAAWLLLPLGLRLPCRPLLLLRLLLRRGLRQRRRRPRLLLLLHGGWRRACGLVASRRSGGATSFSFFLPIAAACCCRRAVMLAGGRPLAAPISAAATTTRTTGSSGGILSCLGVHRRRRVCRRLALGYVCCKPAFLLQHLIHHCGPAGEGAVLPLQRYGSGTGNST